MKWSWEEILCSGWSPFPTTDRRSKGKVAVAIFDHRHHCCHVVIVTIVMIVTIVIIDTCGRHHWSSSSSFSQWCGHRDDGDDNNKANDIIISLKGTMKIVLPESHSPFYIYIFIKVLPSNYMTRQLIIYKTNFACSPWSLTQSTPLGLSRNFNKLWSLGQTSAWLCLERDKKYMEQLWQIHVTTKKNLCIKFWEIHVTTLRNMCNNSYKSI